jgi:1-acyl-sn-glycerol-3-phosphate acyltransferase
MMRGFRWISRRLMRRSFHAVAVSRQSRDVVSSIGADEQLVVMGNHPSWWDPLFAMLLCERLFPQRRYYAPIDGDALEQYKVFAKLGYFGLRSSGTQGAAAFLKTSRAILASEGGSLWITPEGRFADVRDREATLMPGLAHLVAKMPRAVVVPLAIECAFWDERLPVLLGMLGKPVRAEDVGSVQKEDWQLALTRSLRSTQDALQSLVVARQSEPFESLLRGRSGAGWWYDSWRRVRSVFTGKRFEQEHGEQFREC